MEEGCGRLEAIGDTSVTAAALSGAASGPWRPCTRAAHPLLAVALQLNIAFPSTGCQKKLEIEDDAKL